MIKQTYISEFNYICENQVILLTITDGDNKWHYLAVAKLAALLKEISSKIKTDFYFLNSLHPYRKESNRDSMNHYFWKIFLPVKDNIKCESIPMDQN